MHSLGWITRCISQAVAILVGEPGWFNHLILEDDMFSDTLTLISQSSMGFWAWLTTYIYLRLQKLSSTAAFAGSKPFWWFWGTPGGLKIIPQPIDSFRRLTGRAPYRNWCVNIRLSTVLVGGIPTPLKYEFVSWDDDIPNWMESQKNHVPNHQPVYIFPTKPIHSPNFVIPSLKTPSQTRSRRWGCVHVCTRIRGWD